MGRPGVWQLVILLLIIVLLFGARRLPDLARSVGESLKIFKSSVKDGDAEEPSGEPRAGGPGPSGDRLDPSRAPVEGAPRPTSEAATDPTPPSDAAPPRGTDGERGERGPVA